MDIVERLRHTEEETATIRKRLVYLQVPVNPDGPEAANVIESLRREIADLEEVMDREKCALGYLITKRALKKFGAWNP